MPTPRLPPSKRQYVAQPMPGFVPFQHPKLVTEPPSGAAWLHEIKFDGYRMQVRVENHQATLFTRNGHDWTDRLPELAEEASQLTDCILDGELCFLDAGGKPTFSGLRGAIGKGRTEGLVFYAFDVLWRGQDNVRGYPLKDRKEILSSLLEQGLFDTIRYVEAQPGGGAALLQAACRMGLEGVVSKRRDSKYAGERSEAWVKAKCYAAQAFVIGGFVQEQLRRFNGILVGVQEADGLRYAGTVERGFSVTPDLQKRLHAIEAAENPFASGDPPRKAVRWVRPELVAQVQFQEWTASGAIRHATFKGLRDDKDPRDVRREAPTDVI